MKKISVYVMSLFLILALAQNADAQSNIKEKKAQAVIAAHNWLALVDAENYDQAWEETSSFFKTAAPKETWLQAISSLRAAFGFSTSRTVQRAEFKTTMPGAPDGEYVVILFSSSFEKKANAIETITPMLDKDGQWRVSGYYVR